MRIGSGIALALMLPFAALAQDKPAPPVNAPFKIHRIAKDIGQGYSPAVTDMNRDGKPDLVALGLTANAVTWCENPAGRRMS